MVDCETPPQSDTFGGITIGTRVEIRNRYLQTWFKGFQVAALLDDAFLVRRRSDGYVLVCGYHRDDVRPESMGPTGP